MSNATRTLITDELQRQLRLRLVTENLINRDLTEGVIEGPEDSVKLLSSQAATVQDYTGGPITIESVDVGSTTLTPDHKKAFAFVLEGSTNLQRYVEGMANESFRKVLERAQGYVLGQADPAKTGNFSAGDVTYTSGTDNIEEKIADAATNLDEAGVPEEGRYIVLPSAQVREIEDKIAARETPRGDLTNAEGFRGMYRGFQVYKAKTSLFASAAGNPVAPYGNRLYMGYADAVVAVQVIEDAPGYPGGTVVQGLHVAAAKPSQSDAFGRFEIA